MAATISILLHRAKFELYKNINQMHNYYNEFFEIGQLEINFNLYEISLPKEDPVYTLKDVMEKK